MNAKKPTPIDRDKLRAVLRRMKSEYIFAMLDNAIELLPPAKLHKVIKNYLDPDLVRPDTERPPTHDVLAAIKRFEKASLAGEYYQSFRVNSQNFTQQSSGTSAWISEFHRLLDRCITEARAGNPAEIGAAMGILFGLLDQINECRDDIIFFADEGGAWQVGVDWPKVLPCWFKILSSTLEPNEYADRINALLTRHYRHDQDKMLAVARRTATPEQRKALDEAAGAPKKAP